MPGDAAVPDNAAIDALLVIAGLAGLAFLLLVPAIYLRSGRVLPEQVRRRRAEALLGALAAAPTRRDGSVDARSMVWECGRTRRERYQVVHDLLERDWAEVRARAGLTLMPVFLRITPNGWWEWSYRQESIRQEKKQDRQPPSPTVTYLSFGRLVTAGGRSRPGADGPDGTPGGTRGRGGAGGADDEFGGVGEADEIVVSGPSDQHLRELYVALRSDAENILARGLRQDTLDRADDVEQAVDEPDPKKRWAAVDGVGPLIALDQSSFNLTVMVLKRLLS